MLVDSSGRSARHCPSCGIEAPTDSKFCPACGKQLSDQLTCPNCNFQYAAGSKFCQECGHDLRNPQLTESLQNKKREMSSAALEIEPPPSTGITIEFPTSSAQSFDFALAAAHKFATFVQFGSGTKSVYRVTIEPHEMGSAAELLEHMSGWRRRTVYVEGEKLPWDSVFGFKWCYEKRGGSFKPEFYCFGYDTPYALNIWGCMQSALPFTANSEWFCWGEWMDDKGTWKFDKERIRHELEKSLFKFRFCPAIRPFVIEAAVKALPDTVNPARDKNWDFVENWGDGMSPGLTLIMNRYGYKEKVVVKGVSPKGNNALVEIANRMKIQLPIAQIQG